MATNYTGASSGSVPYTALDESHVETDPEFKHCPLCLVEHMKSKMSERTCPQCNSELKPGRALSDSNRFAQWSQGSKNGTPIVTALPRWATYSRIAHMTQGRGRRLDTVAGPALLWGYTALGSLSYFMLTILLVEKVGSNCVEGHVFAEAPDLLSWGLFFIPAVVFILLFQHNMMRYVLLSLLDRIQRHPKAEERNKGFGFLFCRTSDYSWLSFRMWYATHCVLTVLTLLDNMTNALFTARIWSTASCGKYGQLQYYWYSTWSKSIVFGWFVKKLGYNRFDFGGVTLFCYILQLVCQPAAALYYAAPHPWRNQRWPLFDVVQQHEDENIDHFKTRREVATSFVTFSDTKADNDTTSYSTAFTALAEANRMEAFSSQDMLFREACIESVSQKIEELQGSDSENTNKKQNYYTEILELALAGLARGTLRFGLKGCIQNAVMVNLQVSLLAVGKPLIGIDGFNLFSTFLTVIGMLVDVPDMIQCIRFANHCVEKCDDKYLSPENQARVQQLWWRRMRLFASMVAYVGLALLALEKLVFVITCPCGMSNVGGCVLLPKNESHVQCSLGQHVP